MAELLVKIAISVGFAVAGRALSDHAGIDPFLAGWLAGSIGLFVLNLIRPRKAEGRG
jgi:hypothetical protein